LKVEDGRVERSKLLRVNLRVEARDRHGKLVDVREKEGDLILNNFKNLLAGWLSPLEALAEGSRRDVNVVTTGGTAFAAPVWANALHGSGQGLAFTSGHKSPSYWIGTKIRVGTSTVAPTRDDYKLGAEVASAAPSQTVGADYISWAASMVLETAADVAEAGMSVRVQAKFLVALDSYPTLIFRDTFAAISVPAGGTISVTYTLTL